MLFLIVEQTVNAVHVVSLSCFVCAEEDFLSATDEGADRSSTQGRDLITASRSSDICLFSKRSNLCLSPVSHSAWSDYANYYQCLWGCTADEADELDFQRGDLIYIISKVCKKKQQKTKTKPPLFKPLYIFPVATPCPDPFKKTKKQKTEIVTHRISPAPHHSGLQPTLQ